MVGAPPRDGQSSDAASSLLDTQAGSESAPEQPHPAADGDGGHGRSGYWAQMIGDIGVVFGDIGTSPLYA
ncbi:MAG: potassium transporter Kup, partial [Brevundimonas sp.]